MNLPARIIFVCATMFAISGYNSAVLNHQASVTTIYQNPGTMGWVHVLSSTPDLQTFEASLILYKGESILVVVNEQEIIDIDERYNISLGSRSMISPEGKIFCPHYLFGYEKISQIVFVDEHDAIREINFALPDNYHKHGPCVHPLLGKNGRIYFPYSDVDKKNHIVIWEIDASTQARLIGHYPLHLNIDEANPRVLEMFQSDEGVVFSVNRTNIPEAYYFFSEKHDTVRLLCAPLSYCDSIILSSDARAILWLQRESKKALWYDVRGLQYTRQVSMCGLISQIASNGLYVTKIESSIHFGSIHHDGLISLSQVLARYELQHVENNYDLSVGDNSLDLLEFAADGSSMVFLAKNKQTGHRDLLRMSFFVPGLDDSKPKYEPFPIYFFLTGQEDSPMPVEIPREDVPSPQRDVAIDKATNEEKCRQLLSLLDDQKWDEILTNENFLARVINILVARLRRIPQ